MCLAFGSPVTDKFTPGMNAEIGIRMVSDEKAGVFTLPVHAVVREKDEVYVWTVAGDSTVHKVRVTLQGMDGKGQAVISSGLKGDEQVVRAGVNALQENEKVGVMDGPEKTNVGGLL